jgi:ABC-2 type transport system permease protein
MNRFRVIAGKDIREALRSRSTYIYVAVLFFLTFTNFSNLTATIKQAVDNNFSQEAIIAFSQPSLNNLALTMPLIYSILICTIFAAYSVIVDKAKHNLESLMVTPISLKQIWIAKSLAVTIPSVGIALGVSAVGYLVMNFMLIMPYTNYFITPGWEVFLNDLIIVPVLIFFIVALVIYLQLVISNPRVANLVFIGIFLLLYFGVNIISQLGIEMNFTLIYLVLIVICSGITLILSLSLTKERVILSNKG